MPNPLSIHRRALMLGVCAGMLLTLGACSSMRSDDTVQFQVKLSGAQEVPPNASTGAGELKASFNRQTGNLRWTVTYSGLTGPLTGAHFHGPAAAGQNAPVSVGFGTQLASPIQGEANLNAQQAEALLAGRWYVNLHTRAHPGGEIRAQLTR